MSELRDRSNRSPRVEGVARHGRLKQSAAWKTVLGLRDGTSVTVSCDASIRLSAHVYAVDEARALALLK